MKKMVMLEGMVHSVTVVASGARALEILNEQRVDLVITDHAMPRRVGA